MIFFDAIFWNATALQAHTKESIDSFFVWFPLILLVWIADIIRATHQIRNIITDISVSYNQMVPAVTLPQKLSYVSGGHI
jgi:hypothetical protein